MLNADVVDMSLPRAVLTRFSLRTARLSINKRGPFVPSAAESFKTGSNTVHYLIGMFRVSANNARVIMKT